MQKMRLEKSEELRLTLHSLMSYFFFEENKVLIMILTGDLGKVMRAESSGKIRRVRIKAEVNVWDMGTYMREV